MTRDELVCSRHRQGGSNDRNVFLAELGAESPRPRCGFLCAACRCPFSPVPSLCPCLCPNLLLWQRHQSYWSRARPTDIILPSFHLYRRCLQIESLSVVLGFRVSTYEFGGTQFSSYQDSYGFLGLTQIIQDLPVLMSIILITSTKSLAM